jgi:SPP1 gp7 family putative phage head morphogenesis protein
MLPDLHNAEARIDRDKRDREAELAFLLVGLFALAARRAEDAIRVGADPYSALAGVVMGNATLNMRGGTERLAALLLLADMDGWRRTQRILETGETYTPPQRYRSIAAQALARALAAIQRKAGELLARSGGGVTNNVKAIREAVASTGLAKLPDLPKYTAWRARTIAEALVGQAYNGGYGAGLASMTDKLTGFRYSATLDNRTTTICRAYHGVMVKPEDFWVRTHFPPCHFNCRSVILPVFSPFTPTADPPLSPPPMSGFGLAPVSFAGFTFRRDAA